MSGCITEMSGTIITLIEKLLDFHIFLEGFYEGQLKNEIVTSNFSLRNTAMILKTLETKQCEEYKKTIEVCPIKETPVSDTILSEVDFFLITLKQSLSSYGIFQAKQLIANAIDCENKQIFLLSKIIDMLSNEAHESHVLEVMRNLLKSEENRLQMLTPFI